jgi:hypothetical protein
VCISSKTQKILHKNQHRKQISIETDSRYDPKPIPYASGFKRGLAKNQKDATKLISDILKTQKASDLNNTYTIVVKQNNT